MNKDQSNGTLHITKILSSRNPVKFLPCYAPQKHDQHFTTKKVDIVDKFIFLVRTDLCNFL